MTRWNASLVYSLLEKRFPAPAFALLPQVRNGTGFTRKVTRTADAIAMSLYPSRGIYLTGLEIKVSRSDWLKELADPSKADSIGRYCRYWYVSAPKGVIDLGEVPETWGYLECSSVKVMREAKKAPRTDETPIDLAFLGAILRKVQEVSVPVSDVVGRIEAAVENEKKRVPYELASLKESIASFEQASGVSLSNKWEWGDIGAAVKIVREANLDTMERRIHYLRDSLRKAADDLDDALKQEAES